jgi:hypothetical protein
MVHAALAVAGPASTSCAGARDGVPLAGQKLPPVAWLIADDHLALNGALDQLITGGGTADRRPRQARWLDPEASQTNNAVT